MKSISVINTITVPEAMEDIAEQVREEYVDYFKKQEGFLSSTFYRSINREADNSIRYVNIVEWKSREHYEKVVNSGFENEAGENEDGYRVLGKGFPAPIKVSPGQYEIIA